MKKVEPFTKDETSALNYLTGNTDKEQRQKREDMQGSHEHNKYWDSFFKARVNDFALETDNPEVLKAYNQMINGRNTNAFYSENNYINI